MNHRIRTTTTIEQWQDAAWVPVERTTKEESGHADHVVSDSEECWCGPTVIEVPGK